MFGRAAATVRGDRAVERSARNPQINATPLDTDRRGITVTGNESVVFEVAGNPDPIPTELDGLREQGRFAALGSPSRKSRPDRCITGRFSGELRHRVIVAFASFYSLRFVICLFR
jgi:hypothetical protein